MHVPWMPLKRYHWSYSPLTNMFQNQCLKFMETPLRKIMVSPKFNNWLASIFFYIRATLTQTNVTKRIHKFFFIVSRLRVNFGAKFTWQNGKIGLFLWKNNIRLLPWQPDIFTNNIPLLSYLPKVWLTTKVWRKSIFFFFFFFFLHFTTF